MSDPQRIRDLCKAWLNAASQPDGGLAIGGDTERHRLHRNGVAFHSLALDEVRAACLGLSEVLLLRGMNTVIDLDHQLFWAWIGQVLLGPEADVFGTDEREVAELYEVCIRASLAGIRPPVSSQEEWEAQNRRFNIEEPNARHLVQRAHLTLAFLAFPLLEAIAKRAARAYLDYSGTVLQPWSVPNQGGGLKNYSPSGPGSSRCSSIRDLLFLVRDTVAGPGLQADLDEMRAIFRNRDSSVDAFDGIYAWRNQSLHGQTTHPAIGGTVLNVAILISLEFVATDYDVRRDRQVERCRWEQQTAALTGTRSPWSYYPPF